MLRAVALMLSYQPAFDPFHAIFRLIRLMPVIDACPPVEREKVRILDFYMAFPFLASAMSFKQGQAGLRKIAKAYDHLRPYGGMPDGRDVFLRMAPIQKMAAETLAARGVIDPDAYRQGVVITGDVKPPAPIAARASELNASQAPLVELLTAQWVNGASL
jgi:hypothetical protein